MLVAGMLLAGATACEKGPDATEVARSVEEPPPVRGTLVVTAYGAGGDQAGLTLHTTTWVQGKDGYAGMEENDLRGDLDGTFKYGWNQPGQGQSVWGAARSPRPTASMSCSASSPAGRGSRCPAGRRWRTPS